MLEQLNNYDWEEAFKYAKDFNREDVIKIYDIMEGENDGDPWRVYGKLRDGRYFYLEAGCDYTGWGCQESGYSEVADTREDIIKNGLTSEARKLFGLEEDNVGTIEIKEPKDREEIAKEDGFTKSTKEYKKRDCVFSIERQMKKLEEKIKQESDKFKEEVSRHDNVLRNIDVELRKIQEKCPHKFKWHNSAIDSWRECKKCGKTKY